MIIIRNFTRTFSKINFASLPEHRALVIDHYDEPEKNVYLKRTPAKEVLPKELSPKQVLVEHLAACVNPSDISFIRGIYGIKAKFPTVLGLEGITRVKEVGSQVSHLKPGDLALGLSLVGYWQSYTVQEAKDLFKIDNELNVVDAAQLKVNPCTAYRMLKDFVKLKPGDTIIQNGANSAVGVYAMQLAKLWGINTINVIRDRPNKDQLVEELKKYGADTVVTEEEVGNIEVMSPIVKSSGRPKLLLNCTGGKIAMNCIKHLEKEAYIVTYGVMSGQHITVTGTSSIFKDHKYHGFWMSRWCEKRLESRRDEVEAMLKEVSALFRGGSLRSKPVTLIDFEDREIVFKNYIKRKYIFKINI